MTTFRKISFVLFSAVFLFTACKDNYECTAENVAGVYMGVDACNANNVHDETITIEFSGTNNVITYTDDAGVSFNTSLNGCVTEVVVIDVIPGIETKEYELRFSETEVRLTTKVQTAILFNDSCERVLTKQ